MVRFRSIFVMLVCCLVASFAIALPAFAATKTTVKVSATNSPQACGTWHIRQSPNPEVISVLEGVTASSEQDMWTVGGHNDFLNQHHLTLAEHWNGTEWHVSHTVNQSSETELFGVSAISSNDVWAVGTYQRGKAAGRSLAEHWNGTGWQAVLTPNIQGKENWLSSVSAVSTNDVWAVGYTEKNLGNYRTLIEHWDGTSWSIIKSPNVGTIGDILSGVVAVSANNVWAVGDATVSFAASQTLIEHWNGARWSVITSPSISMLENQLSSISALTPKDIWAAGSATDNNTGAVQTLVEHWDGTQWTIVSSPNPPGQQFPIDGLQSIAMVSANDVWAVGYQQNASGTLQTLTEQWNGTQWSVINSPNRGTGENQLKGVVHVPGTSKVVAVGFADAANFSHTDTLIMTTC